MTSSAGPIQFSIFPEPWYASLTANYDNYACATLTIVLFIWNLHWASSQVIIVTEKHQSVDYPEMRPTFTAAELKDITAFQTNF